MKFTRVLFFLLVILVTGVYIAGCTTAPASGTGTTQSPAYTPHTAARSPTAAELNETLAHLDVYAEEARQKWNVPGMTVAVVKDGKIIFVRAYGVKTAGGSDPVTTDTVFEIGSTSKAFTAALVALEVDSGRMKWDDPVIRYLPDFQMSDPWITKEFTLTDALAHRSGLEEKWGQDMATLGYNRSGMIHALRYAEPVTSFRSQYRYQNIFFMVAAAAVENTSRMSWEDNLRTRIFSPLSMKSASIGYDELRSAPDHVSLHMIGELPDGTLGPVPADPDSQFNYGTDRLGPAGSINANVKDMATWAIFQLGNGTFDGTRLMSPENLAYMHTPQILMPGDSTADSKSYYCQGWIYREMNGTPSVVKHTGETMGNHAYVLLVPRENLGIVVLANEAGHSLNEDVGDTFYRMYFGIDNAGTSSGTTDPNKEIKDFLFHPPEARPANPASPLPLTGYTGTYTSNVYGTATVAEVNGNLTMTLGRTPETQVTFSLSPWDKNTFSSTCPAWKWGPAYDGRVTFGTAPDGSVRQLTTTLLLQKMQHQDATFVRTDAASA